MEAAGAFEQADALVEQMVDPLPALAGGLLTYAPGSGGVYGGRPAGGVGADLGQDLAAQIAPQVPSVADLHRFGEGLADRFAVGARAVLADVLGPGVLAQPRCHALGGAVGQDVGPLAGLGIDHHGGIAVPALEGEGVDAEHARDAQRRCRPIVASRSVTTCREAAGSGSSSSQTRPGALSSWPRGRSRGGPAPRGSGYTAAAEPHQLGTVTQHSPLFADLPRGNPCLRQQVPAQQMGQRRGIDLVVLQPGRGDRLTLQGMRHVHLETMVLEQFNQPAPAEGGLERHRRSRRKVPDHREHRLPPIEHIPVHRDLPALIRDRDLRPATVHSRANTDPRLSFYPPVGLRHGTRSA